MKKIFLILLSIGLFSTLSAKTFNPKACKSCHGEKGNKKALGKSKKLSKMSKEEIINALNGYQKKNYGGQLAGLMYGRIQGASQSDIESLAEFFSKKTK
jgi:cytochrome c553